MTQNLHDNLDFWAQTHGGRSAPPGYLVQGLRGDFELRPYQSDAFWNFMTYYNTPVLRSRSNRTLFHMATGSGKTLIMVGLMLFLYKQGYRNFLFFVNSTNVMEKTRDNFLNPGSPKYLFTETLRIDGDPVTAREVTNFQQSDPKAINICFTTIQGLHTDLLNYREGRMMYEDFEHDRVVLISDEAHHINVATKKGLKPADEEAERTWESTVWRILESHSDSLLLEFTATAPLTDPAVADKYKDSVVVDYPLCQFRIDGYSKEINLLRTSLATSLDRALQAVVLSQYRLKLFQDIKQSIRPVVMLKSKSTAENKDFLKTFQNAIRSLDEAALTRLRETSKATVLQRAFEYFDAKGITTDAFAAELREDFGPEHCLLIDSKNKRDLPPEYQVIVNNLETSPYRAVFAVDMLNEGWDVLSLFDIVRLYETQAGKGSRPSSSTVAEAQLIGRGARYCPFTTEPGQDRFTRKFDDQPENPLRFCEELYFHSPAVSQYIDELRKALKETGAVADRVVEIDHVLKGSVVKSDLYRNGWVFTNARRKLNREDAHGLPERIRSPRVERIATGATSVGAAFGFEDEEQKVKIQHHTKRLSELLPAILATALRKEDRLRFDRLRLLFPGLKSMKEFATSPDYLGDISLTLESGEGIPSPEDWLRGTIAVVRQVAEGLKDISFEYEGTTDFEPQRLHEVIQNKTMYASDPSGDGYGVAQSNTRSEELRLDLSSLGWYAHVENYGTPEEKAFLVYFNRRVQELEAVYDLVMVFRNEGQLAIYDFETGTPFQPDFLLFLHEKKGKKGYVQYQIFVEPKGDGFIAGDKWKEDLLLKLKRDNVQGLKTFADDNDYFVWGMPFFNQQPEELREFAAALETLVVR